MNAISDMWASIVAIGTAIVGVAILAVLVSRRSNTAGVISAGGNAFSQMLGTAISPVTGNLPNIASGNVFDVNVGNIGW